MPGETIISPLPLTPATSGVPATSPLIIVPGQNLVATTFPGGSSSDQFWLVRQALPPELRGLSSSALAYVVSLSSQAPQGVLEGVPTQNLVIDASEAPSYSPPNVPTCLTRPPFAPGPVPSKRFSAPPGADPINLFSDHPAPRDFSWGWVARGKVYDGAALASRQNLDRLTGPALFHLSTDSLILAVRVVTLPGGAVAFIEGSPRGMGEAIPVWVQEGVLHLLGGRSVDPRLSPAERAAAQLLTSAIVVFVFPQKPNTAGLLLGGQGISLIQTPPPEGFIIVPARSLSYVPGARPEALWAALGAVPSRSPSSGQRVADPLCSGQPPAVLSGQSFRAPLVLKGFPTAPGNAPSHRPATPPAGNGLRTGGPRKTFGARSEASGDKSFPKGQDPSQARTLSLEERPLERPDTDLRVLRRSDREGSAGEEGREQEGGRREAVLEALFEDLQEKGWFLDPRTAAIRRLGGVDDGRRLLQLLARHIPEGSDLVDLLELIGQTIGWSEETSALNAALHRVASYRHLRGWTKADAVRKPVEDVLSILGLAEGEVFSMEESGFSAADLEGFTLHLALVGMYLDHPEWFELLDPEFDELTRARHRRELREDLQEARRLLGVSEGQFPEDDFGHTVQVFRSFLGTSLLH